MKKFFGFLILQIVLFVAANQAIACTCLESGSLIDSAESIFVGKVIKSEKDNSRWFVDVSKVIKSEVSKSAKIKTIKNANCAWSKFEINEIYVFFVDKIGENYFEPFACSSTATLKKWNTKYRGLSFDFRRKKYQELGMSEKSIAELESKFYEDLANMEIERQEFLQILENGKSPEE